MTGSWTTKIGRLSCAGLLAAALVLPAATVTHADDAPPSCPLGLTPSARVAPEGGKPFVICSGRVPSFDGTPLDVDLSVPAGARGRIPLMVMMHGWGSSKSAYQSTTLAGNDRNTWHWNSAWFASKGYGVLTYTARGFHRSCGQDPQAGYTYATDRECAGRASWTHLADRRWEIRDTQHLVGLLVDSGLARADSVVATGESYGGGQSWLLALAQGRVTRADGSTTPWRSPRGVPIRLAAAVPQYGWTDLGQALLENGRGSDGYFGAPPDRSHDDPIGVEKQSYVTGLYASGESTGQFAPPRADRTADLRAWFAAINAGEPYGENSLVAEALQQLREYRTPYAMPVPPPGQQVPVFAIQGVTDPLFPGSQALQLARRLRTAYQDYPVWTFLGDVGHSYASNPHETWTLANEAANSWLDRVLSGSTPTRPRYTASTVPCLPGQTVDVHAADEFPGLVTRTQRFASDATASTSSAMAPGEEAVRTDPLVGGSVPGAGTVCPTMAASTDPGVAAWTFAPAAPATVIGSPVVRVRTRMTGSDGVLAARLWDVDADSGRQALVTRTVYRLRSAEPSSVHDLTFQLWPTAWQLRPGHRLKLELTQVDAPTWRPDNIPATLTHSQLRLALPVHTAR